MSTDIIQKTVEGICTILDTAAGVVAATGRGSGNIVPWKALDKDTPLPVLVYQYVDTPGAWAVGDTRRLRFQLTAVAAGNGSFQKVNDLLEAVENHLTATALNAQGLDACPDPESRPWPRYPVEPEVEEGQRDLEQEVLDAVLVVTK